MTGFSPQADRGDQADQIDQGDEVDQPGQIDQIDRDVLIAREAAWRAYFGGDVQTLGDLLPPGVHRHRHERRTLHRSRDDSCGRACVQRKRRHASSASRSPKPARSVSATRSCSTAATKQSSKPAAPNERYAAGSPKCSSAATANGCTPAGTWIWSPHRPQPRNRNRLHDSTTPSLACVGIRDARRVVNWVTAGLSASTVGGQPIGVSRRKGRTCLHMADDGHVPAVDLLVGDVSRQRRSHDDW